MLRFRNVVFAGLVCVGGLSSSAGCAQQGTVLDVPASNTTATHYEVFWFNQTDASEANGAPCVGFDGPGQLKAMYVDRIIDDATVDGPQLLPPDFAKNGLTILVTGTSSARVAVAFLNGDQVVSIADSLTPVHVSEGMLRRYPLTTTVTTNATEYRPGYKDAHGERDSVLRFVPSNAAAEFRITPEGSFDFDGDGVSVAFDDTCPRLDGRLIKDADCDDLNAARFPQDNVDTTFGAATDLDCKFNRVAATACTVLVEPPTPAKTCRLGQRKCSDNESGQCELFPSAPEVNLSANYCTQNAVRKWNCKVAAGPLCTGTAGPMTFLATNTMIQPCSIWYSPAGNASPTNVVKVFIDSAASIALPTGQDVALTQQCAVHLDATIMTSGAITPIWIVANRNVATAVVSALSFEVKPCEVGAPAGITCVMQPN